jgi:hypothetical protein
VTGTGGAAGAGRSVDSPVCAAAEPRALRLDQAQHRLHRDRGIGCAAAGPQDLEPGLHRHRIGGGDTRGTDGGDRFGCRRRRDRRLPSGDRRAGYQPQYGGGHEAADTIRAAKVHEGILPQREGSPPDFATHGHWQRETDCAT